MKTGRNFPAKGLSMTILNKLALDIMHRVFTPQQTRSSQNASSWVGRFYFKFVFTPPRSPSGSAIDYVLFFFFFHEGKFIFISSGRTAALQAGNVYGELSAGACVSSWRFRTSSLTFSWRTCCRMCCRRLSWAMPIRSSFLSVSLSKARPVMSCCLNDSL